jgi:hypothetical protein
MKKKTTFYLKTIISHFLKIEANIFLSKITFYILKLSNKASNVLIKNK